MCNTSSRHNKVTFPEYDAVLSCRFGVCNSQKFVTLSFKTHYYRLSGPPEMTSLTK